MFDLNPRYLNMVKEILQQHCKTNTVWAYGSRVNGTAHESSDLDLVVFHLNQYEDPLKKLFTLRNAFEESDLPISVDVFDWDSIPDNFKPEIEKNHFVLQE